MNNRFEIKAQAYLAPIRQYAISEGLPFFKWKDIRRAMTLYELYQCSKN